MDIQYSLQTKITQTYNKCGYSQFRFKTKKSNTDFSSIELSIIILAKLLILI